MAQEWARKLYHSAAWIKNSRNYMKAVVDTSGHVLYRRDGGWFYKDGDREIEVPSSSVIGPGLCERCFVLGRTELAKLVHHKRHVTPENVNDPKVTLAYDNMQRLCQDCHAYVHSDHQGRTVKFDEDGHIIAPDPEAEFREQLLRLTSTTDERRNIHANHRPYAR